MFVCNVLIDFESQEIVPKNKKAGSVVYNNHIIYSTRDRFNPVHDDNILNMEYVNNVCITQSALTDDIRNLG